MKTTFKQLQKVTKLIFKCNRDIEQIKHLPYYKVFDRQQELADDISVLLNRISNLETEKHDLIVKLQDELEILKNDNSAALQSA